MALYWLDDVWPPLPPPPFQRDERWPALATGLVQRAEDGTAAPCGPVMDCAPFVPRTPRYGTIPRDTAPSRKGPFSYSTVSLCVVERRGVHPGFGL